MGRLILYIVVGVVIYLVTKELFRSPDRFDDGRESGEGEGAGDSSGDGRLKGGDEMAQDPICGSFVAREDSPAVRNGDEVTYFCSDECRQEYIKKLGE